MIFVSFSHHNLQTILFYKKIRPRVKGKTSCVVTLITLNQFLKIFFLHLVWLMMTLANHKLNSFCWNWIRLPTSGRWTSWTPHVFTPVKQLVLKCKHVITIKNVAKLLQYKKLMSYFKNNYKNWLISKIFRFLHNFWQLLCQTIAGLVNHRNTHQKATLLQLAQLVGINCLHFPGHRPEITDKQTKVIEIICFKQLSTSSKCVVVNLNLLWWVSNNLNRPLNFWLIDFKKKFKRQFVCAVTIAYCDGGSAGRDVVGFAEFIYLVYYFSWWWSLKPSLSLFLSVMTAINAYSFFRLARDICWKRAVVRMFEIVESSSSVKKKIYVEERDVVPKITVKIFIIWVFHNSAPRNHIK